ncbi:DUF4296 domain-containing protein [Marinoscillum sp.]|uniref:DUF4296 domain-containing protein n=1 Tax=Marinoscillum sp. TaxID=2024838 RepID=UPI003BAA6E32
MKKSFFVILIVLLGSCSKKQTEIPADVLSHDQMVRVLIEVHLLEAKVKKLYIRGDSSQLVYNHFEKMLFEEQEITREQCRRSMEFYVEEIENYKAIYDEVVDSLLARQKAKDIR